ANSVRDDRGDLRPRGRLDLLTAVGHFSRAIAVDAPPRYLRAGRPFRAFRGMGLHHLRSALLVGHDLRDAVLDIDARPGDARPTVRRRRRRHPARGRGISLRASRPRHLDNDAGYATPGATF